jgi:hypothetical protein
MRQPPDWFDPADEIILDYVFDRQPTTPAPIEDYTYLDWDHIETRATLLAAAGLLEAEDDHIYSVTTLGRDYLFGDADLSDVPEPE